MMRQKQEQSTINMASVEQFMVIRLHSLTIQLQKPV